MGASVEQGVDELVGVERRPGRRSSRRAPTSLTGMPSSVSMANTMPPLAEPSSLVSTTPVTSVGLARTRRAWVRPFCPVVASITSSTSVTRPGALLGHPAHLAQLLHQVRLGVQAAGGVGQHEVDVAGGRPLDGVEDDRRSGRRPRLPRTISAPARSAHVVELLGGRGTERVAGGHAATVRPSADLLVGDLADRGGLADAVHADEQPDVRAPRLARRRSAASRSAPSSRAFISRLQRVEQLPAAR